jgi:hypothetical protein
MLAQLLAQQGYRTGAVIGNFTVLIPAFGFDRGFSFYDCAGVEDFLTLTNRPYLLRESVRELAAEIVSPGRREAVYAPAKTINDRTSKFLESAARSRQPFFLFINYMEGRLVPLEWLP